ncbi:T9SS type A sorting domain-containing protein [Bacteroidota bacterium]
MRKLLYILIFLFLSFSFDADSPPPGGWYQQFLPDIGGRQISDMFFLDSLTGWAVTNATNQNPDTTFVLKTTNGGDNWVIQYGKIQTGGGFPGYFRVYFLNQSTGYTCGVKGLDKTTDGGISWISLNAPLNSYLDMSVLNTDSIWLVSSNSLTGGVFRTTNGGQSWTQQLSLGSLNPTNIYFYDKDIGFISNNTGAPYVRKTTDGGVSWSVIVNEGFRDLYFIDSLTGWRANDYMKKTTDGGLNWVEQALPQGGTGHTVFSAIRKFSNINKDTIWGGYGSVAFPNFQWRGILLRTTNGGDNWLYQIPDTSIHSGRYLHVQFVDKLHGWAYWLGGGIHTLTGGDTTFYSGLIKTSGEIPESFSLHQNYPNPFNSKTIINYEIKRRSDVRLDVYDIQGKEIMTLVKQEQEAGTYQVDFPGAFFSSGVYFYRLSADGNVVDTKKILLIK